MFRHGGHAMLHASNNEIRNSPERIWRRAMLGKKASVTRHQMICLCRRMVGRCSAVDVELSCHRINLGKNDKTNILFIYCVPLIVVSAMSWALVVVFEPGAQRPLSLFWWHRRARAGPYSIYHFIFWFFIPSRCSLRLLLPITKPSPNWLHPLYQPKNKSRSKWKRRKAADSPLQN